MIQAHRTAMAPILALAVVAVLLAGCGRKGPLEPPPSAVARQAAPAADTAAPGTTPAP